MFQNLQRLRATNITDQIKKKFLNKKSKKRWYPTETIIDDYYADDLAHLAIRLA